MRFWDSSAIIPLIVEEAASARMRDLYAGDRGMLVWWGTLVECRSGLARRERARAISGETGNEAMRALTELSDYWTEVEPVETVRAMALRLLGVHDLRAADSMQLAAAVVARAESPRVLQFVCLDRRLSLAASKEGLDALGEGVA